jgi:ribosomal protein S18 acetylase RimI-like enzyme
MLAALLRALAPYTPTLVGTFPLGLAVEGSDLDVACVCAPGASGLDDFERVVRALPGAAAVVITRVATEPPALAAQLAWDGVPIEIFGQPVPVTAQHGFRHMIVEGRLLAIGGEALRDRVRARKQAGAKTEPAFAQVLGLDGDPYAAVLALESSTRDALVRLVDRALGDAPDGELRIAAHLGDRAALRPLFRIADDSDVAIDGYLARGMVLVASRGGPAIGHVQLLGPDEADARAGGGWELKSLGVLAAERGTGLGRRLVEAAFAHARARGARRVVLSTGAADTALLRFYQRRGFRFMAIERDVFVPAAGYPADLEVDGIPLRDQVWLDAAL